MSLGDSDALDQLAVDAIKCRSWPILPILGLCLGLEAILGAFSSMGKAKKSVHVMSRLIRFAVFLHQIMKRSVGGIRQRLSAKRYRAQQVHNHQHAEMLCSRTSSTQATLQGWTSSIQMVRVSSIMVNHHPSTSTVVNHHQLSSLTS